MYLCFSIITGLMVDYQSQWESPTQQSLFRYCHDLLDISIHWNFLNNVIVIKGEIIFYKQMKPQPNLVILCGSFGVVAPIVHYIRYLRFYYWTLTIYYPDHMGTAPVYNVVSVGYLQPYIIPITWEQLQSIMQSVLAIFSHILSRSHGNSSSL